MMLCLFFSNFKFMLNVFLFPKSCPFKVIGGENIIHSTIISFLKASSIDSLVLTLTNKMVMWNRSIDTLSKWALPFWPMLPCPNFTRPMHFTQPFFLSIVFLHLSFIIVPLMINYFKNPLIIPFSKFLAPCWPHLRPYNHHKLDLHSTQCIFLDYSNSHKGYRCLHLPTGRLYISQDVVFDEHIFPFSLPNPPSNITHSSLPSILGPPPSNLVSDQSNCLSRPISPSSPRPINQTTTSPSSFQLRFEPILIFFY